MNQRLTSDVHEQECLPTNHRHAQLFLNRLKNNVYIQFEGKFCSSAARVQKHTERKAMHCSFCSMLLLVEGRRVTDWNFKQNKEGFAAGNARQRWQRTQKTLGNTGGEGVSKQHTWMGAPQPQITPQHCSCHLPNARHRCCFKTGASRSGMGFDSSYREQRLQ